MLKSIGYYIFAFNYNICRLFPLEDKRVFCIMTHDDGEDSNVSLLIRELKKHNKYSFSYITKTETGSVKGLKSVSKLLSFFILKPYYLARSRVVLMDNVFIPMAFLRIKKRSLVVQLWHGTGTIKKFGQDANTGRLRMLEEKANRNITHLIVNNKQMAKLYAKVFGIDISRVYPLGLPKTDDILKRIWKIDRDGANRDKNIVYERNGLAHNQKLILYAPTFRDSDLSCETLIKQVEELAEQLPSDYILGLRLHPFVAQMTKRKGIKKVCDLSNERSLAALIMASDLLITDYSSIIFEYCITEKPIIFFAFDLEEFSEHGRGFYENYETYVPGPIARTPKEIIDIIKEANYSIEQIRSFKSNNFTNIDGKAGERIIKLLD
jgi:CDP-ribitol ribitolphosphotransferase